MADFGTNVGIKFSSNVLPQYFERAVAPQITNKNYEGEFNISGGASKLRVITFAHLARQTYTGAALTPSKPSESEAELHVNVKTAHYHTIEGYAKFSSYVSDPNSALIKNAVSLLQEEIDAYVLGFYGDVAAGNRVGTDVTSGTITVTVTTGAFVIAGATPVTSAWVGRGIKCAGHTKWYRVKSVSSTTEGVIEDDLDDVTSAYTGGAIAGGSTYVVEAVTVLTVAKATIYGYVDALGVRLDEAKVPKEGRWLVVPSRIASIIRQSPEKLTAVPEAYTNTVNYARIGMFAGFMVYESQQLTGNATDGWRVLAGHTNWLTFAHVQTPGMVEDFYGGHGQNYKQFDFYGAKVADVNRKAAAEGFWKV